MVEAEDVALTLVEGVEVGVFVRASMSVPVGAGESETMGESDSSGDSVGRELSAAEEDKDGEDVEEGVNPAVLLREGEAVILTHTVEEREPCVLGLREGAEEVEGVLLNKMDPVREGVVEGQGVRVFEILGETELMGQLVPVCEELGDFDDEGEEVRVLLVLTEAVEVPVLV